MAATLWCVTPKKESREIRKIASYEARPMEGCGPRVEEAGNEESRRQFVAV
jgi:hypothetical protein